jgi:two-component system response regulator YesN
MNGLQAIKEIKSLFSDIDIIIISGYDDFLLVREALLLQVADYLLKPINFEELVICLAKIEDRRNDGSILLDNKAMLTDFPHPEKNEMKTIDKMLEFIDENISEPELSLKIIASEFHMNPYYISSFLRRRQIPIFWST